MTALRLVPVVLSLLLLAAHFLRSGCLPLVAASLLLLGLLFVRRPWAGRIIQAALVGGALEWVRTLVVLATRRAEAGEPAARMALILGAVALLTLGSALLFETRTLGRVYRLRGLGGWLGRVTGRG